MSRPLILAAILLASLALPVRAGGVPDPWTLQSLQRAAELFHLDYRELYRTVECETGGWRADVIYGPTTGALGEEGLGQFLGGTDSVLWQRAPWADYSTFEPQAAAFTIGYWWWRDPSTKRQWSCWRLWRLHHG